MMNPSSGPPAATADAEAALAGRAREGDLDAFNALVDAHQGAVYNLCLRMLGSRMPAEDAAQEAFLSAYRGIRGFKGDHFRSWLMRIAANACTDELRRRARRPALSLDTPPPGTDDPVEVPDAAAGPEALALRGEEHDRIQAGLMRLPADQRLAVIMCDVQGFAYEEIAVAMGTSVGTVKSRIARGRDKLRRELGAEQEHSSSG